MQLSSYYTAQQLNQQAPSSGGIGKGYASVQNHAGEQAHTPDFDQTLQSVIAKLEPLEKKIFKMVDHERMAGSVPVWEESATQKEKITAEIETAFLQQNTLPDTALSYRALDAEKPVKPFGFGDIVDFVNPLHHIPVIGHLYREVTGDEIRPAAQIMGGAIYGGAMGAAASGANVIMAQETGADMMGHTLKRVRDFLSENPTARYEPVFDTESLPPRQPVTDIF